MFSRDLIGLMLGLHFPFVHGLSKLFCCAVNMAPLIGDGPDAFDLPTKPTTLVVGFLHRRESIQLTVDRRREETVLALKLDCHHHAVPLPRLLQLRGLHGDQGRRWRAVLVHDHDVMVSRVLDIVTVVEIVLVVTRNAMRATEDVACR